MSENKVNNYDKELDDLDLKNLIKIYIELIFPKIKRNLIILLFLIIFNFIFLWDFSINTYNISKIKFLLNMTSVSQNLMLVLLALLITGYALFQALATGMTLKKLLDTNGSLKELSIFRQLNLYFFFLGISYLVLIFINFIMLIFLPYINLIFYFPKIILENKNLIFLLYINLYFYINLVLIFDFKSFLKNLYDIFRVSAHAKSSEINK